MPTQYGTIWAQWVAHHVAVNEIKTFTVYPQNRRITAEAAISLLNPFKSQHWSETGIIKIVSNGVTYTFDPPAPRSMRSGVTEVQFRTASINSRVHSRFLIHYWT
jgi:hypothetical protein